VTVRVRAAQPTDAAIIYSFICDLAEGEYLRDQVRATPETLEKLLFGEKPAAQALIAEFNGKPRGFALFYPTFSSFEAKRGLWLEDFYVEPTAQGMGLGVALFAELALIAMQNECTRVEWTVLHSNEASRRFYRALGAKPMDEWTTHRLSGEALAALANRL
jgi:GNAT superfamily N-acetyltransferase